MSHRRIRRRRDPTFLLQVDERGGIMDLFVNGEIDIQVQHNDGRVTRWRGTGEVRNGLSPMARTDLNSDRPYVEMSEDQLRVSGDE